MAAIVAEALLAESSDTPVPLTKATRQSTAETRVFESDVRLLPLDRCTNFHGKGKGRLRLDKDPGNLAVYDCGYFEYCHMGTLFPASARTEDYRLVTNDPVHDMKRWMTTPNQRISGEKRQWRGDDYRYIEDSPRFNEELLREGILWGVEEVKYVHTTIRVQLEYLSAPPYRWTYHENPIGSAISPNELPIPYDLEDLDRKDLVRLLVEMALQLDYLKERQWLIRRRTLLTKWGFARKGDWGEIAELLNSGCVDEEQVQKFCRA